VHPQQVADETKLSDEADTPEGLNSIQKDLDKLKWSHVKLERLNKAKCRVLHLGQHNPLCQYRLGGEGIESSPSEKDLGVLVDEILETICSLAAQKASRLLDCRSREVILPLCFLW